MIDIDTGIEHISPFGLTGQGPRKDKGNAFVCDVRMRHFIIVELQNAYPELADRMKENPVDAANILSAFLALVPLQIKGKLTEELKAKIMKTFKVIK